MTKGLILILHSGFAVVNKDECIEALPDSLKKLDREIIEVNYSEKIDLSKSFKLNYGQYALEHRRQFANEILPLLIKRPSYKIIYFGLAPIPMAIDFGQLFHNYRDLEVYQLHHVTKQWYQECQVKAKVEKKLVLNGVPDQSQKGITEALIRLGISHIVNPEDTSVILANAAEVELFFDNPDEDAIESKKMMVEVVEAVKRIFDELSGNRSGLNRIHLFASIPCGAAFLIGSKISPNIHPYVQTYQYSRTEEPKYQKAILVKGQINQGRKVTSEEIAIAKSIRSSSNDELTTSIKNFCSKNKGMSTGRAWHLGIIPELEDAMNEPFWKDLPPICETSLKSDVFDFETEVVNNGFYWRNGKWFVDDVFFISLSKRIRANDDIKKAIRLFLFHEALHYKKHKLTDLTSTNIGSFPKVLETADYQADVYALINEYGFYSQTIQEIGDAKNFFLSSIRIAVETMWSFDDNGSPLEEIQIRRLNRYLIWYLQYARIEIEGNSLNEIIQILEEKPVIELNGLKTKEENNRFFFELEKMRNQPLELALFHKNVLIRNGSATNLPIENIVQGAKEMNGELILNVMRSFISR